MSQYFPGITMTAVPSKDPASAGSLYIYHVDSKGKIDQLI